MILLTAVEGTRKGAFKFFRNNLSVDGWSDVVMPQFAGLQRQVSEMCSGFSKKSSRLDDDIDLKGLPLFIPHDCVRSGSHLLHMRRKGNIFHSLNIISSICSLVATLIRHIVVLRCFVLLIQHYGFYILTPEHSSNTLQSRAVIQWIKKPHHFVLFKDKVDIEKTVGCNQIFFSGLEDKNRGDSSAIQ